MSRIIPLVVALFLAGMGCAKILGLRTARDGSATPQDIATGRPAEAIAPDGSDGRAGSGGSAPDRTMDTSPSAKPPDSIFDAPADGTPAEIPPTCQVEPARLGVAFRAGRTPSTAMGNCSLPTARLSTTRFYGALDTRLLTPEIACGACIEISNANRSVVIVAEIIDLISIAVPRGKYALGLEDRAIAQFGGVNTDVDFRYVDCPENGNIRTTFDSATSLDTIVLIMNQRRRFSRVQILTTTGLTDLVQLADHRWQIPGSISAINNDITFIDNFGHSVVGRMVPFVGDYQDAKAQFPPCP
jgi:hypothetical protein